MTEHYKILRTLGEGSFGKCYLVEAASDNSKCVIKQVDLNPLSKQEQTDSFKEAKILEQLDHPNIIRFREVYKTKKNKLCIVMDFADGGDLGSKIKEQKGSLFPESVVLEVFVQICLALKHVHDRKIIHRDLKSQNVFLMRNWNVKLGDFGIAKVLEHTMANARTMVGTPYYLSPEIVQNRPYSFQSDVWSLGVLLYEMCALRPPFDATSIHSLALKIIEGRYQPLSARYSSELKQLVASMLMREPTSRPTIHQILRLPFIRRRIEDKLSRTMCMDEFSHTVLHGLAILEQPKPSPSTPAHAEPRVQSSQGSRAANPPARVEPPAVPSNPYRERPQVPPDPRQAQANRYAPPAREVPYNRPSDPRADYRRQGENRAADLYSRPAQDYRPSDPSANYPRAQEYARPADYRDYRPTPVEYRSPPQDMQQYQAIPRPAPSVRPVESRTPPASKPAARTPPVSFFVPMEDTPEPTAPTQSQQADQYIARIQQSSSREEERRAMLQDLKQRRAALQNKRRDQRSAEADVYEAYIYEMQAALLEQEGDEVEQLQMPATPADREDTEMTEEAQLHVTSDLGRAEKLRMRLERELGSDIFLNAYRVVADLDESRRLNSVSEYYFYLKNWMTREEQETYVPLIKELISLENR